MQVRSLDQEDLLEEKMATHSVLLPRKSYRQRSPAGFCPNVSNSRVRLRASSICWDYLCTYIHIGLPWCLRRQRICLECRISAFSSWVRKIPWRREGQPTPVFLPGEYDRGAWWATVHGVVKSQIYMVAYVDWFFSSFYMLILKILNQICIPW